MAEQFLEFEKNVDCFVLEPQTIFPDKMQQKKRDLLCRSVRQSRSLCSLRGRNFPPPQTVFNIR